MAGLINQEKHMKSILREQFPYESHRDAGTHRWWPSPGKARWPITGLVTVSTLLTWWLFTQNFLGAQLFFNGEPTLEATDSQKVTRQYNLTVGARWMNLGEISTSHMARNARSE